MVGFAALGLWGMFLSAFLAATILPLGSEIVLTGLLLADSPLEATLAVATLGNVLGALVNYALGLWGVRFFPARWMETPDSQVRRARAWFQKYGSLSLLLAWMPVVGDPLTLVAGMARVNLAWFLCLVTLGKGARYWVLAQGVLAL